MEIHYVLFGISLAGGFLSGYLGLGGAIIIIPAMLTIPQLFGLPPLAMKTVSGISMVQVFFASASGIIVHRKNGFVHRPSLIRMGIPMGIFSLAGSYLSAMMDNRGILVVFLFLVVASFLLLLRDNKTEENTPDAESLDVPRIPSILSGIFVGSLSGMVGAGGGFILMPIMIRFLRIPIHITIGTSLGIVFIGAVLGALGKILSAQVDFLLLIPVILGSLSARWGAHFSEKTPPAVLRKMLLWVIFIGFVQTLARLV